MYNLQIKSIENNTILLDVMTPCIVEYTLLMEMTLNYYKDRPLVRIKRDKSLTILLKELK